MARLYLPRRDSKEGQEIERLYPDASFEQLDEWAKKYGYQSRETFIAAVWKRWGIHRAKVNDWRPQGEEPEPEIQYIPYPDFKIKPFKQPKARRDEEDIGIVFADRHDGKLTSNYSPDICAARTDYLLNSTMTIINLHRPIRYAHIFNLGDNIQGENPRQGSKMDNTKGNARTQINNEVKLQGRFLSSLSQGVQKVFYYGVRGNHGRYEPTAPDGTNWDLFFYDRLKDSLQNQKNIEINYSDLFYLLVNIRGFRFFGVHGDQCKGNAAVPLIAARRKMAEWYALVGGFNYAYMAHFHTKAADTINTHADYVICPPLVTGDDWAVEMVGRATSPQQHCFGIHDHYGRTFQYQLHTDDAFLPNKFDEPEGVVRLGLNQKGA
jgi:hypothetical protein